MNMPEQMTRVAIVGTTRQSFDLAQVDERLAERLANRSPEAQVLLTAASYAVQAAANYSIRTDHTPLGEASPPDTAPVCSLEAMHYLDLMLGGLYQDLLPEWFREVAKTGRRVPEETLYRLLKLARNESTVGSSIWQIVGERGRWLHKQMGERARVSADVAQPANVDELIERIQRAGATREWNLSLSRQTVSDVWTAVEAGQTDVIVERLHQILGHEFETLLEWLLEIKRFRNTAAQHLMQIPTGRFRQEMRQRVTEVLTLERMGHARRWCINFKWYTGHNRDEQYALRKTFSEQLVVNDTRWTPSVVLELIQPTSWCDMWGITSPDLIEAGRNSVSPFMFFNAWIQATMTFSDVNFAEALLSHRRLHELRSEDRSKLAGLLSAEQRERVAIQWLSQPQASFDEHHPAVPILRVHHATWSEPLMAAFLKTLEHSFRYMVRPLLKPVRRLLRTFAPYFPISLKDDLRRVLSISQRDELSDAEKEIINEFVGLIDFRLEMLEAIHS